MILGLQVWHKGKQLFLLFLIVSHLNALQYDTLFSFTSFMSQIVLYILHSTPILSFYTDAVLTLCIRDICLVQSPTYARLQIAERLLNASDYNSTMMQLMAWCSQATNHYMSKCWPRTLSPHGATRPRSVKVNVHTGHHVVSQGHMG